MADRMGWLCEDCYAWVATLEAAEYHSDEWQHSLAVCPESRRGLRMWTIYQHPRDLDAAWVVRPSRVLSETEIHPAPRHWPFDDLKAAHAFLADLPDGLVCVQRVGEDPDPTIYEVWV